MYVVPAWCHHILWQCRGSALTGGSSGGPWIANYGIDADLRKDANYGQDADRNVVMAVTSWGYEDPNILLQGASFFGTNKEYPGTYGTRGSGNIAKLMYDGEQKCRTGSACAVDRHSLL